ncbi:MAG: hypothetical protein KGL39_55070 [Patescibacteria group bacterium]|nr:hypothetical protein [Patescibacteria group bacterium]
MILSAFLFSAGTTILWPWLLRNRTVKRRCAWCKKWLGGNPLARTTGHGICRACKKTLLEETDASQAGHGAARSILSAGLFLIKSLFCGWKEDRDGGLDK